ncbi:MAG: carbamoyltransferase [Actinobacteria bacterium]|nr:carbamoyltransferase [Actinomycetota bacterium]MCL6105272.1 carbamoyltransferase [Actinomycetota bacterium]
MITFSTATATNRTAIKTSVILGVNCFSHDSAACILINGRLIAFGEEERFNRQTHTKEFPNQAIQFCLDTAGLKISDVDVVGFAHKPWTDLARGARDAMLRLAPKRMAAQFYIDTRLLARQRKFRQHWGYKGEIVNVGHHEAHAAGAFYPSPFEQAAVLTLDRGGDFLSTTLGYGEGNRLELPFLVKNPHSLGEVYSALTWYLGFIPNIDEGKVMGLAPYGGKSLVDEMKDFIHLEPNGLFKVNFDWFGYQREAKAVSSKFFNRYGPRRIPESEISDLHKDLAFGIQNLLEESALHVAKRLREVVGSDKLCLSGGIALNSVANTRLLREAGFDHIFIPPAASDAGNALGAALWVWHKLLGHPREDLSTSTLEHPFWGVKFSDADIERTLKDKGLQFHRISNPTQKAAQLLAESKIVGWFSGRAEMGPRALGARSILADPRRQEMRDIVNAKVKRREWFRPFAPSILDERGPDYFEGYYPNPFMLLVMDIKMSKRKEIPAVTHVDGTGRLQSVNKRTNPVFWQLIKEFEQLTTIPVVLNTSFNLRGEPMVHRPAEAIDDFLNSAMDALFLESYLVEKTAK